MLNNINGDGMSKNKEIDEVIITRLIVNEFIKEFSDLAEIDAAVVGAGPSGLTAARYLAKKGVKVVVFEKNLHVGGGMWAGGIMFPKIVVQDIAKQILSEIGIKLKETKTGYYIADSVEAVTKCAASALDAGAKIWIGFNVEDVMIRSFKNNYKVYGVVINWYASELARFHVDPVTIKARVVIDASGHSCEVVKTVLRKIPEIKIDTTTGNVIGEKPMWADVGEKKILENTREVLPGLIVSGMAANAVYGSPRMGPIFGGMFLSGKKAAEIALKKLKEG